MVQVTWLPSSDPNLADSTPGSGVAGYKYRYAPDGGAWTSWTDTVNQDFLIAGMSNGSTVQVRVKAIDYAGNEGPMTRVPLIASEPTATYDAPGGDPGDGLEVGMADEPATLVGIDGSVAPTSPEPDEPAGWPRPPSFELPGIQLPGPLTVRKL